MGDLLYSSFYLQTSGHTQHLELYSALQLPSCPLTVISRQELPYKNGFRVLKIVLFQANLKKPATFRHDAARPSDRSIAANGCLLPYLESTGIAILDHYVPAQRRESLVSTPLRAQLNASL